jgi:hypothetical protein
MPSRTRTRSLLLSYRFTAAVALALPILTALFWSSFANARVLGVRLFYEGFDLNVFYKSSRWAAGEGWLYKDVFSEYPLLPNLFFGAVRAVSDHLSPMPAGLDSFAWVWISVAWITYVFLVRLMAIETSAAATFWLWVAPAPLYFSLFRYDLYPAAMTFLCLLSLRRGDVLRGGLWLGLTIAAKGYALFLLPAFGVYLLRSCARRRAVCAAGLAIAPLALCTLAVFAYAGPSGVAMPYAFHAKRGLNNESTYDALVDLTGLAFIRGVSDHPWIAQALQASMSLLAAGLMLLRRASFDDLVNAFLLALTGFMAFSIFYSPQFLLWILPVACFSSGALIRAATVAFSWLTFFYYPIVYDLRLAAPQSRLLKYCFGGLVAAVACLRMLIIGLCVKALWPAGKAQTSPSAPVRTAQAP